MPCCTDVNGQNIFGNVFEDTLKNIWNGKKAVNFEKIISNQKKIGICELCSGYGLPNLKNMINQLISLVKKAFCIINHS